MSTNIVTVTAPNKKPMTYTFEGVSSIQTPAGKISNDGNKSGNENVTIKAGANYDKIIEFFTNLRDANISNEDRKNGKTDGVINEADFQAFASGKRQIEGYQVQALDEWSIYKKENDKVVLDVTF